MEREKTYDNWGDPVKHFNEWYNIRERSGIENYNAVALSSSDIDRRVSSRIVLLKKHSADGFVFYTNYESRKGHQLSSNPFASLLFYWPEQRRQVRIEGRVVRTGTKDSDDYFNSRIHGHKLNAIASRQSSQIPDKQYLVKRYEELAEKYRDIEPPRPEYWGGFMLIPELFEFWQEGKNRFHDRIEYRRQGGKWVKRRLAP